MQLMMAGACCGLLLGEGSASGSERLEAAVYGGRHVSDPKLMSATAFAAVDGEGCPKFLKQKVVALSKTGS